MNDKKIIVALDSDNFQDLKNIIDEIKSHVFAFKIGYEFFLNFGLDGYRFVQNKNVNIFLDLKLHDIPNTIKHSIETIANLNPYFTTIHISGGDKMLQMANLSKKNVKILGVTILTSLDYKQTEKYYNSKNINDLICKFIKYAINNKLDGIVCSPHEIKLVKKLSSSNLIIVTPGIRPINYNNDDDQKRFMTPKQAVNLGADFLVIGRPITQSSDPLSELISINSSIEKI